MWPARPELASALADQYTIHSVLGVGGTATVYRATDEKHNRDVAVKVLHLELAATLTRQRFARETSIAAQLQHPHILPLIDSGAAAGTYYYVMPLVAGVTLRERMLLESPLSPSEATRILADLADALVHAHEQGVVHRDIKPSNVLLAGRHALLMDFGVAKGHATPEQGEAPLTVGVALGTPTYMAPEQAMASPDVDHRADLYALGVLGYELLVGEPPFVGGAPRDVLLAHVSRAPTPLGTRRPDVPAALEQVVMRCLAKDPEDRWPDAAAMLERLDVADTPTEWATPVEGMTHQRGVPFWKRPVVALPVAALAIAGAVAFPRLSPEDAPALRPEQLTHVGNAIESAVSPDGDWLAYVTLNESEHALFVRDLSATTAIELDRGDHIAGLVWSPDGLEVAYHTGADRDASIRAIPRLGGAGRLLGTGHGLPSPDLTRLAIADAGAPYVKVIEVAEGDTTYVARPDWVRWTNRLAWSPDSKTVAIGVAGADYAEHAILVTTDEGVFVEAIRDSARTASPSFSRDGRSVYFVRQEPGQLPDLMRTSLATDGRPFGEPQLVVRAFDGTRQEDLFKSDFHNGLTHATDGHVIYTRTDGESNVVLFELDGSDGATDPTFITTGSALHNRVRMAPDQRHVASLRTTRGGKAVGITPIDGGPFESITQSQVQSDLAWSPSGDRLAVTSSTPRSGIRLSVYDIVSGALRPIEIGEIGTNVTWVQDRILVQGPEHRALYLVDPESGSMETIVPDTVGVGYNFWPRASSDGTRIAFFKRHRTDSGIWIQELSPGTPARLLAAEEINPLRFDTTGEFLYATDNGLVPVDGRTDQPRRILRISVQTGEVQTMKTLPPGFVAEDITQDGSAVLATRVEWRGDVWRLVPQGN